jgi:tetratricopeptide (TPR) repeat protein
LAWGIFAVILLAVNAGLLLAALMGLGMLGAALWLVLGPGPQRTRAASKAARLLKEGDWEEALAIVRGLLQKNQPAAWEKKLEKLEGEALEAGGEVALREGRYEDSDRMLQEAAPLLGVEPASMRQQVVDAILNAVRSNIAAGPATATAVNNLLKRALALQPSSAEVHFWKALSLTREGPVDQALASFDQAHQLGNKQNIDPPLYMGLLLHKQGRPGEALRILTDANRIDSNCPFVALQMGVSMVATGGDSAVAVRILQKALGARGLPMWLATPNRAWVEAFPTGKSFVRRLAEKHAYTCPILGADLKAIIRQGELALGQAYYRQGSFQESADVFNKLLQEAAPTLLVLRGLGLALTRLGKHDQAFKHLRAALEMEPTHGLTAGYLALCGAKGRPTVPEDRPRNVAWAIQQVSRFDGSGNSEYAAIMSAVHAEARSINLEIAREDQVRLCNVLGSVRSHDPDAAGGYLHLAKKFPDAVRDDFAWLFGRAAVVHGTRGDSELDLFARVFRDRAAAQSYFGESKWDLEEVELLYLDRFAEKSPQQFPSALGASYPPRGEELLLQRSAAMEEKGDKEGSLRSIGVLLRLAPKSVKAHDRAAGLYFRRGDLDKTQRFLGAWQNLDPADPMPVVRRAIIEQQQGNQSACLASIQRAVGMVRGPARASVAFLGARLMLALSLASSDGAASAGFAQAEAFLVDCLREQPGHVDGAWMLAALRAASNNEAGLKALAPLFQADVADARYQLMAAVCHLVAGDAAKAVEAAKKASGQSDLAGEGQFIQAWAHLARSEDAAAFQVLQKVAVTTGPSADLARALLGRVGFQRGIYPEAVKWWTALDAGKRTEWKLDDALRQTVLLAGLVAFRSGHFEQAAERFREAGKLGLRDKRLGSLIGVSLFKAGQQLLYQNDKKS